MLRMNPSTFRTLSPLFGLPSSFIASASVNVVGEAFAKYGKGYSKIEDIYRQNFIRGFQELTKNKKGVMQKVLPDQMLEDYGGRTIKDIALESFGHCLTSALSITGFLRLNSDLITESTNNTGKRLSATEEKRESLIERHLNRRKLLHLTGAAVVNSTLSFIKDEHERAIANAIQRLSDDKNALTKIAELAQKDGKAMASNSSMKTRNENRKILRQMFLDEKNNPKDLGIREVDAYQPASAALKGTISTLANLLIMHTHTEY